MFNRAGKKNDLRNPKGGLLLIETTQSIRLTTWDSYSRTIIILKIKKIHK